MKTVLITGSQGFIGSYLCKDLLDNNYHVIGIDNYSKYGKIVRAHDTHENFTLFELDAKCISVPNISGIDYIINCAAMIGGISYFHKYAYDLLAENERICAAVFDYAIKEFKEHNLLRIISLSSSMVFESTDVYPTPEHNINECATPKSSYGFQKLATEYFCKAAYEQYGLPYTIIRPFNCVGIGEDKSLHDDTVTVGNTTIMMSHVLPDIVSRAIDLGSEVPFPILGSGQQIRCYTNGVDVARGIRIAMESSSAINQDFNISTPIPTTVMQLVSEVFEQLYCKQPPWIKYLPPFEYDVQKRIPTTDKARTMLGISCDIPLSQSVAEVISWIKEKNDK